MKIYSQKNIEIEFSSVIYCLTDISFMYAKFLQNINKIKL